MKRCKHKVRFPHSSDSKTMSLPKAQITKLQVSSCQRRPKHVSGLRNINMNPVLLPKIHCDKTTFPTNFQLPVCFKNSFQLNLYFLYFLVYAQMHYAPVYCCVQCGRPRLNCFAKMTNKKKPNFCYLICKDF